MPKEPKDTGRAVDPELVALDAASQRRANEGDAEFPPTWDPNAADHPNPITAKAFPLLQKPPNSSSPLVELEHIDGRRFTVWLSDALLKHLIRAGVREGMPVSIHRSAEKRPFFNEKLGRETPAWGWTVTTPQNQDLPVRGGQVLSIDSLTAALMAPEAEKQVSAGGELEPDTEGLNHVIDADVANPGPADDDEIPF